MKIFGARMMVGVAITVGLIIGGCATWREPLRDGAGDPAYSASPETANPPGFGAPPGIFGRYPELEDQAP